MSFKLASSPFLFLLQVVLLAILIYALLFAFTIEDKLQWEAVFQYRDLFLCGWYMTIAISFFSLILSLIFGVVFAGFRRSSLFLGQWIGKIYVEGIRGTPLLVQILFFYYVVAHNVGIENRYIAGTIILSLFHGAYITEMIRVGIENVSRTQLDSARAIGLNRFQIYRYVIFPQAIRQVIPPLTGQFASIIKDSSLLSIIGINELTNSAQQINSVTYSTFESFFPLGIAYLLLTLPISMWSKQLEKKFRYET